MKLDTVSLRSEVRVLDWLQGVTPWVALHPNNLDATFP